MAGSARPSRRSARPKRPSCSLPPTRCRSCKPAFRCRPTSSNRRTLPCRWGLGRPGPFCSRRLASGHLPNRSNHRCSSRPRRRCRLRRRYRRCRLRLSHRCPFRCCRRSRRCCRCCRRCRWCHRCSSRRRFRHRPLRCTRSDLREPAPARWIVRTRTKIDGNSCAEVTRSGVARTWQACFVPLLAAVSRGSTPDRQQKQEPRPSCAGDGALLASAHGGEGPSGTGCSGIGVRSRGLYRDDG